MYYCAYILIFTLNWVLFYCGSDHWNIVFPPLLFWDEVKYSSRMRSEMRQKQKNRSRKQPTAGWGKKIREQHYEEEKKMNNTRMRTEMSEAISLYWMWKRVVRHNCNLIGFQCFVGKLSQRKCNYLSQNQFIFNRPQKTSGGQGWEMSRAE